MSETKPETPAPATGIPGWKNRTFTQAQVDMFRATDKYYNEAGLSDADLVEKMRTAEEVQSDPRFQALVVDSRMRKYSRN